MPEYFSLINDNITVLTQIESQDAVDNIDTIAAVDGIFMGTEDLSAALGYLGALNHPEVQRVIQHIFAHARAQGKPSGILAPAEADARRYLEWGARFVAVGAIWACFAAQPSP